MTDNPNHPRNDLQGATTRNRVARQIIAGFNTATPSEIWQYIDNALADTPPLAAEVARLRDSLDVTRLNRANLAAAGMATIAAHHDGEPDPLSYLRDELAAQGYRQQGDA